MKTESDILVIDDEEVILGAISKIAKYEGLSSDLCDNVKDALAKIENLRYKLIITDIMMPDVDGFELLRIVNKRKLNTPVVVTTGFSTLENAVTALYEGAIGFIPKPFSIEEMTSIIKRGMSYGEIFTRGQEDAIRGKESSLDFIPCPPKYHRMGFDSWMYESGEGVLTIGLTDLFLKSIGMIKEVEFMHIEETIYQGGNCLKVTDSEDYIHQLLSPVSGKIIDINEKLVVNQSLLEKDPYFNGWVYKMIPSDYENEIEKLTPCSSDI